MSAEDNSSPPPLESDDEQDVQTAQLTGDSTQGAGATPASQTTSATPSNTPVVNLFSKVPQPSAQNKRSFEGEGEAKAAPGSEQINELLGKLNVKEVSPKKAPTAPKNKADPEDEDADDDDEEGGDEDDEEEEEDEYVATKDQMEAVVPLLRENQAKIDELKLEYQKARRDLEIKFQALREVHYKERTTIVHGKQNDSTALPGFWLDTMQRSMLLAQFIEENDEPALIFLDDITIEELTEDFGYKLTFHFAKNPFFTNETLTKTIKLANLYAPDYQMPDIDESIGTKIDWLPEKNLTVKIEVTEVRPKIKGKKGKPKEVRQEVPCDSFFNFFSTREEREQEELEAMTEEEHEAYQRNWEMDFAIASTLRAKIIPDACMFYLGEADDSDYEDEDGDEDEEDEDDEDGDFDELDEDEDEDDDEDDDEDEKPKGKKGGKGSKGGKPLAGQGATGKEGEPAPECKQQ